MASEAAQKAEHEIKSRVWVGGLPEKVTEAEVRAKFERYGQIAWVRIRNSARDVYAFIQFREAKEARLAVYEMDQSSDFGTGKGGVMKVSMAKPTEAEAQIMKIAGRWSESPRRIKSKASRTRQRCRSPSCSRSRSRSRSGSESRRSSSWKEGLSVSPRRADGGRAQPGARDWRDSTKGRRSNGQDWRPGKGDREGRGKAAAPARDCSRSLPRMPRREAGKPRAPVRESGKGGEGKGKQREHRGKKALRVRVENMPPDFTDQELRDLGSGFGRLVHARIWSYQGRTFANLMYDDPEEAMKAFCGLHDRKVDGWSEALKVQIPCPHCDAMMLE
ncbi:unnamed protein product [Prorocentrum cordatum]|uniref:RRM domain-containing protein n=1 Tax=Prorocentrum cordatum TaxID=2364126 RepID=A0ABN9X8T1_9DINO|nr:unnamed protein product [Polarella glacialis]